jgi:hypothetical protein
VITLANAHSDLSDVSTATALILPGLLLIAVLLWTQVRRGALSIAGFAGLLAWIAFLMACVPAWLLYFQPAIGRLPGETQRLIASRYDLVRFLFWLAAYATAAASGLYGIVASLAMFGLLQRSDLDPCARVVVIKPFVRQYWELAERRLRFTRFQRTLIWLHHAAFSVALLCVAGVGLLLTFGFPERPLAVWHLGTVLLASIINPMFSDTRRIRRMTAAGMI